jgi:hypothetical protein
MIEWFDTAMQCHSWKCISICTMNSIVLAAKESCRLKNIVKQKMMSREDAIFYIMTWAQHIRKNKICWQKFDVYVVRTLKGTSGMMEGKQNWEDELRHPSVTTVVATTHLQHSYSINHVLVCIQIQILLDYYQIKFIYHLCCIFKFLHTSEAI